MTCPLCNDTGYKDHASMLCLDPCVHGEGAQVRSVAEAPLPETIEGLRRQNSSYRALCKALEAEQAIHTAERRKYHEAVKTLDSEREANAMLTAENERLREALERCAECDPESAMFAAAALDSRRAPEATEIERLRSALNRAAMRFDMLAPLVLENQSSFAINKWANEARAVLQGDDWTDGPPFNDAGDRYAALKEPKNG